MVRVPRELAVLFAQDATRAGISQSDRMAEILASLYASSGREGLSAACPGRHILVACRGGRRQRPGTSAAGLAQDLVPEAQDPRPAARRTRLGTSPHERGDLAGLPAGPRGRRPSCRGTDCYLALRPAFPPVAGFSWAIWRSCTLRSWFSARTAGHPLQASRTQGRGCGRAVLRSDFAAWRSRRVSASARARRSVPAVASPLGRIWRTVLTCRRAVSASYWVSGGRAARSWAVSRARAVSREGPYQVRLRPSTSATCWPGNISGPSPALKGYGSSGRTMRSARCGEVV